MQFVSRLCIALLLLLLPQVSHAFYGWEGEQGSLELSGLLRGSGLILHNPDNLFMYQKRDVYGMAGSGRLMLDAHAEETFSVEIHGLQRYVPKQLQTGGNRLVQVVGVERSDILDWSFANGQGHTLIDRLNVQFTSDKLTIKAGRQPVNLATTFYFTPNDFFAPFAAQTFFRSFKPGVDALRADFQLAELSQLSMIGVLGYQLSTAGDNGWSNGIDSTRNSYLTRLSSVFGDFEVAALGGLVRKNWIIGGDFQGELFNWLGIRGEGHLLFPDKTQQHNQVELSAALEHRWESSLTIRLEQFYHGGGARTEVAYGQQSSTSQPQTSYLARHYTALGASYELTPLLTSDATAIHNWVDNSSLLALYIRYSLSNEAELAVSSNLPMGCKSKGLVVCSEFGMLPHSLNVDARVYF